MATSRAQAKAATAEKVAAVAHELFTEHGYEAVTIRTIASKVGMSVGAVFSNYDDKDALFQACMGRPAPNETRVTDFLARVGASTHFDHSLRVALADDAEQLRRDLLGRGA